MIWKKGANVMGRTELEQYPTIAASSEAYTVHGRSGYRGPESVQVLIVVAPFNTLNYWVADSHAMSDVDLYDPKLYINRELSWLEFNQRCLDEANNKETPVLEKVKFLAICYNNLDEFFMIRVPGLMIQATTGTTLITPDYLDKDTVFALINEKVKKLVRGYESTWRDIRGSLSKEGISIKKIEDLDASQMEWVRQFYKDRIHAVLTPLALDVSHPFPFISNNSLNLAFRLRRGGEVVYARLKVPTNIFDRFIQVPSASGRDYVLLEDIIKDSSYLLFPGLDVLGAYSFCVTRNADVKVTIDEACDLMSAVEESLGGRDSGFAVRMCVDARMPKDMVSLFGRNLKMNTHMISLCREALLMSSLWELTDLDYPALKDKPLIPYTPPELAEDCDIFEAIKQKDWILYHPYETFATIIRFIHASAEDPNVQSIKVCLYRVGKDPSIFKALKTARERGKTVSVLMELRAKFDENRNIQWAKDLESIGVHVVYGPIDLKVHSKLLQVVRLEGDRLVRYTHLSSGNYNVSTAKQYADISFLTANQEIGEDVGELFNALTGYFGPREYHHLLVAPISLKSSLISKIDREIQHQTAGEPAHIVMKANGLIDADIIASLYRASMAGVRIDLNIRGLCCLRPGVTGVSDNIRVISIVDRFLEHSRIYYFENGGDAEMYMGSSDMMPRNLMNRVEVLYPILDRKMLQLIKENIMRIHFMDNVKARVLQSDGSYVPVKRNGRKPLRSQEWFIQNRGVWHGQ
jgi:polyphosphate kinase